VRDHRTLLSPGWGGQIQGGVEGRRFKQDLRIRGKRKEKRSAGSSKGSSKRDLDTTSCEAGA